MEEAQQFVEGLIHTPSSQREQKEGVDDVEVMQAAPSGGVVDSEQTHTSAEKDKDPAQEKEKVQEQKPEDEQSKEEEVGKKAEGEEKQ